MDKQAIQQQALSNARNGQSFSNYPAIIQGFMDKGIAAADISPRENVFTFHAWKALGRSVRKGEHGVKVCTYVPMDKTVRDESTGEGKVESWKAPRMTTVFHVSQTDPVTVRKADFTNTDAYPIGGEKIVAKPETKQTARAASTAQADYYSTEFTPT